MRKGSVVLFSVFLLLVLWLSSQLMGVTASQGGSALSVSLHLASTSHDAYTVTGSPTISASFIDQVLSAYGSPAAGTGQVFFDEGVKNGIDPVFALAFFQHESGFGTTGEARATLSIGNERCLGDRPCIDQDRGGYAHMYSWADGIAHWYLLIRNLYVNQWGRDTVARIIPKYAPTSDGNNEAAYIQEVEHAVDVWRSGRIWV
jgi:hypothetical protein